VSRSAGSPTDVSPPDANSAVAQSYRDEWGRLLALLVARYRRLDLAEDALAEAFEAATRTWPRDGIPANPAAWLLTAARRRALDRLRAEAVRARTEPLLVVDAETHERAQRIMVDPGDVAVTDERLRLVLLAAHPALAPEAAAALTLRLVLGVSTADLARLFLVSEPTMAARLTRARRKLATAGVAFTVPEGAALAERIDVVATVAYLAFTAGYAPGSGPDVVRTELAGEAIRLVRVLRTLVGYAASPGSSSGSSSGPSPRATDAVLDPLLALMLLQHSRRDARVDDAGALVLLPDQDRSRWRQDEIAEALTLLAEAPHTSTGSPSADRDPPEDARSDARVSGDSRWGWELRIQALIAAGHATAPTAAATDWHRIAGLYDDLEALTGSPVVRLNRAVAVAEAHGPAAGLALLEGLDDRLPHSHRLPAVRAELLARVGDTEAASAAYEQAISLCDNDAERAHLIERLQVRGEALAGQAGPGDDAAVANR